MEFFRKAESKETRKPRGWHGMRAQMLALALLVPAPALAQQVESQGSGAQSERVEEDMSLFLSRLSERARTRTNETAWTHVTSPHGEEFSYYTADPESEQPTSVLVNLAEMRRLANEGYSIVACHTHPGENITTPSTADVRAFLYGAWSVFFTESMSPVATEQTMRAAASRYEECVMTSGNGSWRLRVVDMDQVVRRLNAEAAHLQKEQTQLTTFITDALRDPELYLYIAAQPAAKDVSITDRALTLALMTDSGNPRVPEFMREFARRVQEFIEPFEGDPAMARLTEIEDSIVDSVAGSEEDRHYTQKYILWVRQEFGVAIEWDPLEENPAE